MSTSLTWLKNLFIPISRSSGASGKPLLHPGAWIEPGECSIEEFLERFKPSVQNTKYLSSDLSMHQVPHFWVITKQAQTNAIEIDSETFMKEGEALVAKMTAECLKVKEKERQSIHDAFNVALKELSERTNIKSGKWLIQSPPESVDAAFASLSLSLTSRKRNTLARTSAHTIKVTSTTKRFTHEMNVHCGESFDEAELKGMAKLMADHGVVASGYECDANTTKRTPLYAFHTSELNKAKMVEFAGYDMPLVYDGAVGANIAGGAVAEHHQVRKSSGLFDVSHMVQSTYSGPGAFGFLSRMLPASLASLPISKSDIEPMGASLSVMLNPEGGIIDDCMITRWGQDKFYLVTNAGRAERDLAWLRLNVAEWNSENKDQVSMEVLEGWGLVALQGPSSHLALQRLLPTSFSLQKSLHFAQSVFLPLSTPSPIHIARLGYTGEDGFEISIPPHLTERVSQLLLDQEEVKLAGLACRDSLRLEAGLCLYGHDLNESTGVGEAGLGWLVGKDRREPGSFIGSERTFAELKKGGTTRKRIGLVVEKGPPAREGAKIYSADGSAEIGIVTSGLPSPTLGQNISMGYIQTLDGLNKKGTQVLVEVRKKMRKAEVVSMPWSTPGYYKG